MQPMTGFQGRKHLRLFYRGPQGRHGEGDDHAAWMVRVQHTAPERTEDYDRYVARAVLLFEVK